MHFDPVQPHVPGDVAPPPHSNVQEPSQLEEQLLVPPPDPAIIFLISERVNAPLISFKLILCLFMIDKF